MERQQGLRAIESSADRDVVESALFEIKRVIAGQDEMLERVFVCLLAGGHLLIEGVPGLAKTLTIKTVADVLGAGYAAREFHGVHIDNSVLDDCVVEEKEQIIEEGAAEARRVTDASAS